MTTASAPGCPGAKPEEDKVRKQSQRTHKDHRRQVRPERPQIEAFEDCAGYRNEEKREGGGGEHQRYSDVLCSGIKCIARRLQAQRRGDADDRRRDDDAGHSSGHIIEERCRDAEGQDVRCKTEQVSRDVGPGHRVLCSRPPREQP